MTWGEILLYLFFLNFVYLFISVLGCGVQASLVVVGGLVFSGHVGS